MKKTNGMLLVLVMASSLLAACGKSPASPAASSAAETVAESAVQDSETAAESASQAVEEAAESADLVTIQVNVGGGDGNIAVTDDGSEPEVDSEYPMQSAFTNVEKGTIVKILAEPEEGYHFFKWTNDGEDYSTDALISVTAQEDMDLLAEFLPEGKDGKPVDLDSVKTLGDLLELPEVGSGLQDTTYVYAFEQDGSTWRALCDVPQETADAIFALDFDDPDYDQKHSELIAPLSVRAIENLTEGIPSQEDADQYLGKTGQELLDDGWTVHYYNLEDLTFKMTKGIYAYDITFEGKIEDPDNFNEDTDMGGLTVKTISPGGVSDPTYMDE